MVKALCVRAVLVLLLLVGASGLAKPHSYVAIRGGDGVSARARTALQSNFAGEVALPATPVSAPQSQLTALLEEFASKNRRSVAQLVLIGIVATVSATTVPLFFSRVLAALTAPKFSYPDLLRPLSMMLLCHTIEPLTTIFYVRRSSELVDRLISALRTSTYKSVLERNVATLEAQGTTRSDVTQLVTAEMDRMKVTLMQNISRDRGVRALMELLMGLTILYRLCLPLALLFSTFIPVTAYISSRFANKMFEATRREQASLLVLSARATETIQNLKEVYAFSNAPLELRRYGDIQSGTSAAALATGRAKARFEASNRAGIYANIIAMFSIGGLMVQRGIIIPTVLVSFIGYCWSLNFATQGLLFSYGDFKVLSASFKRISDFLGSAAQDPATAATPAPVLPSFSAAGAAAPCSKQPMKVDFKGASFSYPTRPDVAVIADVNLSLKPGSVTALVGPSGSGKSTLANLLCRLYEAKPGSVFIDDKDMSSIPVQRYLERVSIVRQQPTLFTDTVYNNIAYGAVAYRPVGLEEVVSAAKAANAHDFISALPEGYNTVLGSGKGMVSLSGGQQQRVCIARALLKDAPLLILDESTSALDSESEAAVQESLLRLMKGRTTVVVAHRLSTIRNADNICVVREGRVVEQGTHGVLMSRANGFYKALMSTQIAGFENVVSTPPVLQSNLDGDSL
jgi:ABC-type multidrug transport system fused ATPase/permease subunit